MLDVFSGDHRSIIQVFTLAWKQHFRVGTIYCFLFKTTEGLHVEWFSAVRSKRVLIAHFRLDHFDVSSRGHTVSCSLFPRRKSVRHTIIAPGMYEGVNESDGSLSTFIAVD